jgi:hypothetical protein
VLIYFRPGMRQSAHHPEPFESPFESPFGGWPHLGAGFSAFDWSSLGLGVTRLSSHAQWNSGPPGNQTQPQKKATYTSIGGRGCVSRPMSRSHSGRHSGGGPILGRFSASSLGALWNLGPPRNSAETDGTWGHPRIKPGPGIKAISTSVFCRGCKSQATNRSHSGGGPNWVLAGVIRVEAPSRSWGLHLGGGPISGRGSAPLLGTL